ncbi:hypothetical protein Ae201684P_015722 [Aphanomyces euteiches]|uniref:Transposase Tc1-like domain-containing protein n=1 Tax=Aphanomyces euteiches TaxID=100861 RepID=A0A6G0WIF1_9STRA|nr:hypothetical protein Ae201684_014857 [Aphanomyces euteiches]KAH9072649.1 hypothetical protein Ae201684P_015722 [Aphanomyces euteiches]
MPRGTRLTQEEIGKAKAFSDLGKSNRWIAKQLGRDEKAIRNLWRASASRKTPKKPGRRIIFKRRDIRRIFRLAIHKNMTSRNIAKLMEAKPSHTTILRVLRSSKFAKYRKRKSAPFLTPEHKRPRVNFAAKYLNKSHEWPLTIFSDEKKFNLRMSKT